MDKILHDHKNPTPVSHRSVDIVRCRESAHGMDGEYRIAISACRPACRVERDPYLDQYAFASGLSTSRILETNDKQELFFLPWLKDTRHAEVIEFPNVSLLEIFWN